MLENIRVKTALIFKSDILEVYAVLKRNSGIAAGIFIFLKLNLGKSCQ